MITSLHLEMFMYIVTGANGFIGSQMVQLLNEKNITNIVCTDSVPLELRTQPLQNASYKNFLIPTDLFPFLKNNSSNVKAIFHMGACSDTQEFDVNFLKKNNTDYSNKLFSFCTENPHCSLIYASSGAVYGQSEKGFSDDTPPEELTPLNPYGWSKLNSDVWVNSQTKKPKNWYGLRFFNVYGPNEYHKGDMRSVVHKAFGQIKSTGKLKLFKSYNPDYENGKQMRDFVYVKDIVEWMWQLYKSNDAKSDIYNMGYGQARTWLDLAKAVFKSMDKPFNVEWIDMPESLIEKYQYFTEAKMQKMLAQNLTPPKWAIEDGVHDYIQNHLIKETL